MKRKSSRLFVLIFIGVTTPLFSVLAISGACSSHNGVNCSAGPSSDGSVICNDGWINSSVGYYEMNECEPQMPIFPTCSYPVQRCTHEPTTEADAYAQELAESQGEISQIEQSFQPLFAQADIHGQQRQGSVDAMVAAGMIAGGSGAAAATAGATAATNQERALIQGQMEQEIANVYAQVQQNSISLIRQCQEQIDLYNTENADYQSCIQNGNQLTALQQQIHTRWLNWTIQSRAEFSLKNLPSLNSNASLSNVMASNLSNCYQKLGNYSQFMLGNDRIDGSDGICECQDGYQVGQSGQCEAIEATTTDIFAGLFTQTPVATPTATPEPLHAPNPFADLFTNRVAPSQPSHTTTTFAGLFANREHNTISNKPTNGTSTNQTTNSTASTSKTTAGDKTNKGFFEVVKDSVGSFFSKIISFF